MNIFEILKNLFTSKTSAWILDVDDKDINPVIIQRFLVLHNLTMKKSRILNKFVYTLSPKQYLAAAWSILFFDGKKLNKAPFIRYPKKIDNSKKYSFIHSKIKRQYFMSDKDIEIMIPYIDAEIEKDKPLWFSYYGVDAHTWKMNDIDVDLMKLYGDRPKVEVKRGLDAFF